MKISLLVLGWLAFTAFTISVGISHGALGFVALALREPWGMQMLGDLAICFVCLSAWIYQDAPKHGLTPWPYIALSLTLGSVGFLPYLIRRELVRRSARVSPTALTA